MYSIHDYGDMIADHIRTAAYARALRQHITPQSVVLDIGAGTGMLTLIACQAGAKKVYAIEADSSLQIAQEMVDRNGFSDRVECIQAFSTDVQLPEQVDIIVSDLHGVLPFFGRGIASVIDARRRFLRPGGALIPREDTLWASLASTPEFYNRVTGPWEAPFGFDGSVGRERAVNVWTRWEGRSDALAVPPVCWCRLDYATLDETFRVKGALEWTLSHTCDVHGLSLWFDCRTADGCGFSNSPASAVPLIYKQGFFPFERTLHLESGDVVQVDVRADFVGTDYVWSWNTRVARGGDTLTTFRQSQFLGASLESGRLRKTASTFVPVPTAQAVLDRLILDQLFAGVSLEEIARRVVGQLPDRFNDWKQVFERVARLSVRYSE